MFAFRQPPGRILAGAPSLPAPKVRRVAHRSLAPRLLRVGFLCPHNPHDATAFSGTAHHMLRALSGRRDLEVKLLGGHRPPGRVSRLLGKREKQVSLDVDMADVSGLDLVLGLTATRHLDRIAGRTGIPCVHLTDATPAFLRTAYGWSIHPEADLAEARVIRNAALTIYSSDHMAARAVTELGAGEQDVAVVPFGANFRNTPERRPKKLPLEPLQLLWVGSSWERKGGVIALAALKTLGASGRDARLTLVGEVPKEVTRHPGVVRVGYLDKNRPREAARLEHLFAEAHLFVLPTRADCTPMVVAEANAHGTPVLITETGGVGSLMAGDLNGRMLAMEATAEDWAEAIRDLTADPEAYTALCRTSFAHARTRLTWDAWARDVVALLRGRVLGA